MLLKIACETVFFFGSDRNEKRDQVGRGVIAFCIPDVGFVFRSTHLGGALECEYQALIALCRFVEANGKMFKGRRLEFLCDTTAVVHRLGAPVDPAAPARPDHSRLQRQAAALKRKLGFTLHWIPAKDNRAALHIALQPTVMGAALVSELVTDFLEAFKPKQVPSTGNSNHSVPF